MKAMEIKIGEHAIEVKIPNIETYECCTSRCGLYGNECGVLVLYWRKRRYKL